MQHERHRIALRIMESKGILTFTFCIFYCAIRSFATCILVTSRRFEAKLRQLLAIHMKIDNGLSRELGL